MATTRPRGRNEVVEALLESARRLIAEQGPGVALRDIAEDAGVNFGLIYQYVGTKEQLIREVYDRATQSAAARLAEAQHLDEAIGLLMTFGDGSTARLIGWAALEGTQSTEVFRDSPALEVLAKLVLADSREAGVRVTAEEAKVFAALAMVVALGWRLFGGVALSAAGLGSDHPERYDQQMRGYLERLAFDVTHPWDAASPVASRPGARTRTKKTS